VKLFEPDTRTAAGNVARLAELITSRTRVVQVSHVTAPTGILMPVGDMARLCRSRNIWFHVDGAQSAGMFPVGVREIGCDSFATSGHKWLGAPHETGVLWVKRERLDEVAATFVGAYSGDLDYLPGDFKLTPTALRYEYGTRNAAAVVGLAEALKFQQAIGRDRIEARGRQLTAQLRRGLMKLRGVEILTPGPADLCCSMLTFRTDKLPYDQLFGRLMKDGSFRCRPVSEQKLNALRVSTHVFNSPAECDALVAAVGKILQVG
jgi:selenocysteine lyase/cysteine desulfurase